MVSWGEPINDNVLSYLKGIGIRVHTVRYQKFRNRMVHKDDSDCDNDGGGRMSSREFLKLRGQYCFVIIVIQVANAITALT